MTTRFCGPTSPYYSPRTRGASDRGPVVPGTATTAPTGEWTEAAGSNGGPAGGSNASGSETEADPPPSSDDATRDAPWSIPLQPAALPPLAEGPGSQIGPYRLLQQIGEGGMGAVFMAEQDRPVRRRVALKVIKPGMDSAQVLARFEAERQALALMEHPNIARVLDAGATDSGRPFFVMELIKGIPITQYCDEARLSPRERLELFVPVCQAIQHAHQKGIIHRDIKPSNVLVTEIDGKPVPRVIDFGIAKATDQRLTERTLFTQFGSIVGTLEYMSPEQASLSGTDVDTRADIYSLGVLLYELLTGTTPLERYRLREAGYAEILRRIKEEEPPKPSTRLSGSGDGLASIAARRGMEPARLTRQVRGELDWIVMRALEKDRDRRYETATHFARDVERFLTDEPVEACPPSAGYRLRKFARRHRAALSTAAAIAAVLIATTGVSVWQAIRATRAERHAVESAEVVQEVNNFFVNDILRNSKMEGQLRAGMQPDPDIKMRTLVDRAAGQIERRFAARPLIEAAIRDAVGNVYSALGLASQALPHLERAYELRRRLLGESNRYTIGTMNDLGIVESDLSLFDRAEAHFRQALALARGMPGGPGDLEHMLVANLSNCLTLTDRHAEAESLLRQVLRASHGGTAREKLSRIIDLNKLGAYWAGAEERPKPSLSSRRRCETPAVSGDDHPMVPELLNNLAQVQASRGRFAEAERMAREALEAARRLRGDRHPDTLSAMGSLGRNLVMLGRLDEAEAILRRSFDVAREAYGEDSLAFVQAAVGLAGLCRGKRDLRGEAEALLRRSQAPARRIGPGHAADVDRRLGLLHREMGRYQEAEREFRGAEAVYQKEPSLGPHHLIDIKKD